MRCSLALLATLLCSAAVQAVATEAVRDATFVAIALRRTDSVEIRQAALAETFEAAFYAHDSAELPPAPANAAPRKNWFLRVYDRRAGDARGAVPGIIPLPAPGPSFGERLGPALGAALAPWKALLEYAWGGAWAGTNLIRSC
ncbi:MAG: hypothetical protein WC728_15450 [Elusimicrobiota bacterium]